MPFAIETIGVLHQVYAELVNELGGRLKAHRSRTGDKCETVWLAQHDSVSLSRGSVLASPWPNRQQSSCLFVEPGVEMFLHRVSGPG